MINPNPMGGKSEEVIIQGKGKYIWVVRPNPQFDDYRLVIYPDNKSLEILKGLKEQGMKNLLRKDDDGYNMQFKRPIKKDIKDRNTGGMKTITFLPPVVVDENGDIWPNDKLIGSGSDLTVKLEVYSHGTPTGGKAKAARIAGVKIDNLVPYTKEKDLNDEQREQIKGLDTAPRPIW